MGATGWLMPTIADTVCEMLAHDEAVALERIASLEADVASYRELAVMAISALRELTQRHDRLREQHARLRDQYQALREEVLGQVTA